MAYRRPSTGEGYDHNWSHAHDDDFDVDTVGPTAVAEDPAVFRTAVDHHDVSSVVPTGPGDESGRHELEREFQEAGQENRTATSDDAARDVELVGPPDKDPTVVVPQEEGM